MNRVRYGVFSGTELVMQGSASEIGQALGYTAGTIRTVCSTGRKLGVNRYTINVIAENKVWALLSRGNVVFEGTYEYIANLFGIKYASVATALGRHGFTVKLTKKWAYLEEYKQYDCSR